ncbi:MAG: DUF3575 domain-containing protein [Muribaculaceae bacterium]|nr:DUF3575 domain-containing protein [Muribaculaceae bacterium]
MFSPSPVHCADIAGDINSHTDTVVFRFKAGRLLFRSPFRGNENGIAELERAIEANRVDIESGRLKIRVMGFCTSFSTERRNLLAARNRSNQVKSYFIVNDGLKEDNFITTNYAHDWNGMKDVVALAYFVHTDDTIADDRHEDKSAPPAPVEIPVLSSRNQEATQKESDMSDISDVSESVDITCDNGISEVNYDRWAIKTNALYLAAGVANIGGEYAFAQHWSVDVPLVYSPYTIASTYRMRFLYLQPEARFWLGKPMRGHFFGVHLHAGVFNVSVDRDNRYQSEKGFYGAGLSYGYSLPFARRWSAGFTVGVGYAFTRYCTYYNIPNGMRYEKDRPYNYWGLTKLGVSIIYRFGDRSCHRKEVRI